MLTRNSQRNGPGFLSLLHQVKGRAGKCVIGNICSTVITLTAVSKGNYPAWQTAADLLVILNITVDDQKSLFIQLLGKQAEGMTDIIQILEEIQMVCFYI